MDLTKTSLDILDTSVIAAEILYRGRAVTWDGYLHNGSTHVMYAGIADDDAAIGDSVKVNVNGSIVCESGAAITPAGEKLGVDATGRVVEWASGVNDLSVGYAAETASALGKEIRVILSRQNTPSPAVDGLGASTIARATFDATGGLVIAAYPLGVTLPANAWITRAYYEVTTTFTSAGADAGTIAIHAEGANDIVTATAISAGGNIWDDDNLLKDTIIDNTIAAMIKTSVARELTATVAVQNLTAGVLILFVEYVVGA